MISSRVKNTNSPPLVKLGELANQTKDCIKLSQGVPYYQPPNDLLQELVSDISNPNIHRYTMIHGIIELKTALAEKLSQENTIKSNKDEITITPGANQAFVNTIFTLTDPGDKVILLSPYYFNHHMACSLANLEIIQVPVDTNYHISHDTISNAIQGGAKAIVIVNPGNPTGAVFTKSDVNLLIELLAANDIWLISDETYEYFTYQDKSHISIASIPEVADHIITIGSFSKTFGIPGYRLGFYHANKEFTEQAMKVQDTNVICAPAISQYLGLKLLENRDKLIPKFKRLMENNHNIAKDLLEEVKWLEPENGKGAYYLFPKQTTGKSTIKLANKLIIENKVALVPGVSFGKDWDDHLRISFANVSPEMLKEAFSRIKNFPI